MISGISIFSMVLALLMGICIPVAGAIYGKKQLKSSIKVFFLGCIFFFISAIVLESWANSFILSSLPSLSDNAFLYALYEGLMAGFFEETGRLCAYKFFLKNNMENDNNSIMYGLGHGGFEAFYILVPGMIAYLVLANMINNGNTDLLFNGLSEASAESVQASIDAISSLGPSIYLLSIYERLIFICAHVALSVIVWFAVKNEKYIYFGLAILLHMIIYTLSVILNSYVSSFVLELVITVIAAGIAYCAYVVWKKEKSPLLS